MVTVGTVLLRCQLLHPVRHLVGRHKVNGGVGISGDLNEVAAGNVHAVGLAAGDRFHHLDTHAQILAQRVQQRRRTGLLLGHLPGVFVVHKAAFAACAAHEIQPRLFTGKTGRRVGKARLIGRRLHALGQCAGRLALHVGSRFPPQARLIENGKTRLQLALALHVGVLHLGPRLAAVLA